MTDQEKIIYDILCSDEQPPKGQHWEGFVTNKIVAALAQPEPEPVAIIEQLWGIIDDIDTYSDVAKTDDKLYRLLVERKQKNRWKTGITTDGYTLNIPLYTTPPQREWQGLTDEEMMQIYVALKSVAGFYSLEKYARAIEAKLKEKNT